MAIQLLRVVKYFDKRVARIMVPRHRAFEPVVSLRGRQTALFLNDLRHLMFRPAGDSSASVLLQPWQVVRQWREAPNLLMLRSEWNTCGW